MKQKSNIVQYTYMFPWVWNSVLRAGGCLGSRVLVDMSAGVRDTLLIPPVRCMPHQSRGTRYVVLVVAWCPANSSTCRLESGVPRTRWPAFWSPGCFIIISCWLGAYLLLCRPFMLAHYGWPGRRRSQTHFYFAVRCALCRKPTSTYTRLVLIRAQF